MYMPMLVTKKERKGEENGIHNGRQQRGRAARCRALWRPRERADRCRPVWRGTPLAGCSLAEPSRLLAVLPQEVPAGRQRRGQAERFEGSVHPVRVLGGGTGGGRAAGARCWAPPGLTTCPRTAPAPRRCPRRRRRTAASCPPLRVRRAAQQEGPARCKPGALSLAVLFLAMRWWALHRRYRSPPRPAPPTRQHKARILDAVAAQRPLRLFKILHLAGAGARGGCLGCTEPARAAGATLTCWGAAGWGLLCRPLQAAALRAGVPPTPVLQPPRAPRGRCGSRGE